MKPWRGGDQNTFTSSHKEQKKFAEQLKEQHDTPEPTPPQATNLEAIRWRDGKIWNLTTQRFDNPFLIQMQSYDCTGQLSPDLHTAVRVHHVMRAVTLWANWHEEGFRAEQTETQSSEKWSLVSSDSYLDMSPQYHSASCNEPLAASFTPLPFTGVMGFVGLGGRAVEEMRDLF